MSIGRRNAQGVCPISFAKLLHTRYKDIAEIDRLRCEKHGIFGELAQTFLRSNCIKNRLLFMQKWRQNVGNVRTYFKDLCKSDVSPMLNNSHKMASSIVKHAACVSEVNQANTSVNSLWALVCSDIGVFNNRKNRLRLYEGWKRNRNNICELVETIFTYSIVMSNVGSHHLPDYVASPENLEKPAQKKLHISSTAVQGGTSNSNTVKHLEGATVSAGTGNSNANLVDIGSSEIYNMVCFSSNDMLDHLQCTSEKNDSLCGTERCKVINNNEYFLDGSLAVRVDRSVVTDKLDKLHINFPDSIPIYIEQSVQYDTSDFADNVPNENCNVQQRCHTPDLKKPEHTTALENSVNGVPNILQSTDIVGKPVYRSKTLDLYPVAYGSCTIVNSELPTLSSNARLSRFDKDKIHCSLKAALMEKLNIICVYKFCCFQIRSKGNAVDYASCKDKNCNNMYRIDMSNPTPGTYVIHVRARNMQGDNHDRKTWDVRGWQRQQLKKKLKEKRPTTYRYETIDSMDEHILNLGNMQDVKSMSVVKKVRCEALAEDDLDKDDVKDLLEQFLQGENDGSKYLQEISLPLGVLMFSKDQFDVIKKYKKDISVLFLDATGSVVRRPTTFKSAIYYYAGVVNISGTVLPLLEFISAQHSAAAISNYLIKFKRCILKEVGSWPVFNKVVVDYSFALMKAIMLGWNEITLARYLKVTHNLCQTNDDSALHSLVTVHICCSHFVHLIARQLKKNNTPKKVRPFILKVICMLIVARSIDEQKAIFSLLIIVLTNHTVTKNVIISLEALSNISKKEKVQNILAELIPESISLNVSVQNDDIESFFSENLHKNSPFHKEFKEIYDIILEKNSHAAESASKNIYFMPSFGKELVDRYMPMSPLWSQILPNCSQRYSNSNVENWFFQTKSNILNGLTHLKVGRFVRHMCARVKVICKMLRNDIPRTFARERKANRQTTPTILGCSEVKDSDPDDPDSIIVEEVWQKTCKKPKTYFEPMCVADSKMALVPSVPTILKYNNKGSVKAWHYTDLMQTCIGLYGEDVFAEEDFKTLFGSTWLTGAAIDACVALLLTEFKAEDIIYIPAEWLGSFVIFGQTLEQGAEINNIKLSCASKCIIPYNTNQHWTLITADFNKKIFSYIDPIGEEDSVLPNKTTSKADEAFKVFKKLLSERNKFSPEKVNTDNWNSRSCAYHQIQTDFNNCGIFVIFFIQQIIKGAPLNENFKPNIMRKELVNKLCSFTQSGKKVKLTLDKLDVKKDYPHPLAMDNGLFNNTEYYRHPIFEVVVALFSDICRNTIRVRGSDYCTFFNGGELTNTAVDAGISVFIKRLKKFDNIFYQNIEYITVFESNICLDKPHALELLYIIKLRDLNKKNLLIMPNCVNDNHWCLLLANLKSFELYHLDPLKGNGGNKILS
ncbi:uncharacterized protein LOC134534752 isoform X1 [Bacillus rossius redtenbacheri]|uniref:uncharacterized protein LOC134534752 isoform X1 n=1 Tax=Bacillus rossius redtenbacheri TaxID=93214 RepID=UPI002FDD5F8C